MRFSQLSSAPIPAFAALPIAISLLGCASKTENVFQGENDVDASVGLSNPQHGQDGGGSYLTLSNGDSSTPALSTGLTGPTTQTSSDGGGIACPSGLQCNVACPSGQTTTVTGTVYDPAGKNPIYNVAVYVPAAALQPLPQGVPTGSDACSCTALFQSAALASTTSGVDGTFTLTNVPVGANVPLVIQVGKWRRQFSIQVNSCTANALADKSIALPSTVVGPGDNLPDIAVSTGASDSLECLFRRIGLPASEYVAGAGTGGHIHIFSGGKPAAMRAADAGFGFGGGGGFGVGGQGGSNPGAPEAPAMAGAPPSDMNLWSTQAQLMPYDIVLLSCEGGETYDANPPALEAYLNAGGRAFASHYHYSWFAGPLASMQNYSAPSDWGPNLATWTTDDSIAEGPVAGAIVTTLNGSTTPFPKGVALDQWLKLVGALGQNMQPAADLSIYTPRSNAVVSAMQPASQPWITWDNPQTTTQTMYFSFDTPVNPPAPEDGGAPQYCGRAVFSDLHVGGNPMTRDTAPPPGGCDATDLSPQEKALEFMLFDLSSCVVPDTIAPPTVVVPPPR
jgi:hypothetical protein